MMCITDFQHINYGEWWVADVYTPETAPLGGPAGEPVSASGISTEDFIEAALLFDMAKADPSNTEFQSLAWYLFDHSADNPSYDSLLAGLFTTAPVSGPGDVLVYIWDGNPEHISGQYGSDDPQIFLGSTPEPSSLLLLGTGLSLLAFGLFRSKLIA
jgi:hypothetical protein